MQDNNCNSCIILAGGLGTRLAPLLNGKPKCLAEINNKSFLKILLNSLLSRGISNFLLALGKGHQQVIEEINKPWANNLNINYIVEQKQLGTGGAIKNALYEIDNDECLVMNGDTLITGDLNLMKKKLDIYNSEFIRIGLVKVSNSSRYGRVRIVENLYITNFSEKGESGQGLISSGFYRIKKDIFKSIKSEVFSFEDFIITEIKKNKSTKGVILNGSFIDIGIPEDFNYLCENELSYV